MNLETYLLIGVATFGVVSLSVSVLTFVRGRRHQNSNGLAIGKLAELETALAETQAFLEESRQMTADHARRIAWLDAKIRQSRFLSVVPRESSHSDSLRTSSIGERRRRVMKLASTGQKPKTIATALGMMPGEVELILNLSNHHATLA